MIRLFRIPSFFLIFLRWTSTVFSDRCNRLAISLEDWPCLIKSAISISAGVRLKNSEILNEVGLNIPLHPNLSERDIQYIVKTITGFGKI